MNLIKNALFTLLASCLLFSCVPEPDYADEPSIQFLSIENKSFPNDFIDSVYIRILIQDGDGDLGLSKDQTDPPYSPTIIDNDGNTVPNRFVHNYFIDVKRNENGTLVDVPFLQGANFNGRYPVLQDNRGALEVNLTYGFEMFVGVAGSPIENGDELVFDISIADRALNVSNTITTEPIIIGQGN